MFQSATDSSTTEVVSVCNSIKLQPSTWVTEICHDLRLVRVSHPGEALHRKGAELNTKHECSRLCKSSQFIQGKKNMYFRNYTQPHIFEYIYVYTRQHYTGMFCRQDGCSFSGCPGCFVTTDHQRKSQESPF